MARRCDLFTQAPRDRIDLGSSRYRHRGSDYPVWNALLYLGLAREAVGRHDFERACRGYRRALETWQTANLLSGDAWSEDQELTNREYAAFLLEGPAGSR